MSNPTKLFQQAWNNLLLLIRDESHDQDRVLVLYRLLNHVLIELTERDQLQFHSLFARIAWISTMSHIPTQLNRLLHQSRIDLEQILNGRQPEEPVTGDDAMWNAMYALVELGTALTKDDPPEVLSAAFPSHIPLLRTRKKAARFIRHLDFIATSVDEANSIMAGTELTSGQPVKVHYNQAGRSDLFNKNIADACRVIGLPLHLSLVDVEIDGEGMYSPKTIVVEPDYLVDISSIAECFAGSGPDSRMYVLSGFLPRKPNVHILLGNIVNFMLDELLRNHKVTFKSLLPSIFALQPVHFALLDDEALRMLLMRAERQFGNLREVVTKILPATGVRVDEVLLEPSFYAPMYGIQGRLDVFYNASGSRDGTIVELKSGSPFNANIHGLSSNHYIQTLLYDLLVKAVYRHDITLSNYILYSSQSAKPLRYAPPVTALQREAIRLRNDILIDERAMCDDSGWNIIDRIKVQNFPEVRGYIANNIIEFEKITSALTPLEIQYFSVFNKLITNEYFIAKVGEHGRNNNNGLAAIWREAVSEKEESFNILPDLEILSANEDHAEIELSRKSSSGALTNFRNGDIAVLYPHLGADAGSTDSSALRTQIFKCSVVLIDHEKVIVRLRNKQVNYKALFNYRQWQLEHDVLDSSFHSMRRALFGFAINDRDRRELFLGIRPPKQPPAQETEAGDIKIDSATRKIIGRAIVAPEYFLLWGPPGTGKTSIVLKQLVKYFIENTSQRIMLLAYTNRAVDEICLALDSISDDIRSKYLRIGSRISTGADYRPQLLSSRLESINSRKALLDILKSQRVVVGTVASMSGKPELFELLKFDTVIVDEASQILEPHLSDILLRFKKWILIGDHKQLPAVVAQPGWKTRINNTLLNEINLSDTRRSYFERMFELCRAKGWEWACGSLYRQGRMHSDIMRFPSEMFYSGMLEPIPLNSGKRDLRSPLELEIPGIEQLTDALGSHRMVYVPVKGDGQFAWSKTNNAEAREVVAILKAIDRIDKENDLKRTVGVVTPFRAQIANIRDTMHSEGLDPDRYTIDTVERYQGSARDIIVLSVCVQDTGMLEHVSSMDGEGVDRKLNVAITRAREQFIWLASPEIAELDPVYKALKGYSHTCVRRVTTEDVSSP